MKYFFPLLAGWGVLFACTANAALFSDEEAHNQIRQLLGRVAMLEGSSKQQAEIIRQQVEMIRQQVETIKQQMVTRKQQASQIYELEKQIDAQKVELRRLRGQDEELMHGLQDAEKRQKNFYLDLDGRLRHFEKSEVSPPIPKPVK